MSQEENIYYNFHWRNDTEQLQDAIYEDQFSPPLLYNSAYYKLRCLGFECNLHTTEMFKSHEKDLKIGLYYAPDNLSVELQLFPDQEGSRTISTFSDLIDAPGKSIDGEIFTGGINAAFSNCFKSIIKKYEALHGPKTWKKEAGHPRQAPFIIYHSATSLFTIYNDRKSVDSNYLGVQVYLSADMYRLFQGLPRTITDDYDNNNPLWSHPQWERLRFYNEPFNANIVTLSPNTDPVIVMAQQYRSTQHWWTPKKILLIEDSLVRKEIITVRNNMVKHVMEC